MTNLYNEVVTITDTYFGPAADRFVARQVRNHLQRDPATLHSEDLQDLLDWIELAVRLISTDRPVIDRYMAELAELAQQPKRPIAHGKKART